MLFGGTLEKSETILRGTFALTAVIPQADYVRILNKCYDLARTTDC